MLSICQFFILEVCIINYNIATHYIRLGHDIYFKHIVNAHKVQKLEMSLLLE